jgi:hypothetical protein
MERRHRACKDPASNVKSRRAKNRNPRGRQPIPDVREPRPPGVVIVRTGVNRAVSLSGDAPLVVSLDEKRPQSLISRQTGHLRTKTHLYGFRVNQDPAHEIAGLEYLFANKKDFGGDDNARQKLSSVLI